MWGRVVVGQGRLGRAVDQIHDQPERVLVRDLPETSLVSHARFLEGILQVQIGAIGPKSQLLAENNSCFQRNLREVTFEIPPEIVLGG